VVGDGVPGGAPHIKFKLDHKDNNTRVAAEHGLLYSVLRLKKSLKIWHIGEENDGSNARKIFESE